MSVGFAAAMIAAVLCAVWLKKQGVRRTSRYRTIAGVCDGLAYRFDWDVTAVRVIWVILAFTWGASIALYILLWFMLDEA